MLSSRTRRSGRGTSAPRCRDRGSYRHRARRLLQATFIAHWRGQGSDRPQDRSSVLQRFAIRTDYVDPRASYYETRYPTRVVNNLHGRAKALGFVLQALEPQVGAAVSYESFSSVNSPLLAFSDFTSTAGATARGAPRAEHVRSPALKLSFPGRHRMGWTSKCSANWAIVRSPLTAASATFALKAGLWLLRGHLFNLSCSWRSSPLSGRNSNYRPVQICGAGFSEEWRQVLGVRLECSARSSAAVCQVAASP